MYIYRSDFYNRGIYLNKLKPHTGPRRRSVLFSCWLVEVMTCCISSRIIYIAPRRQWFLTCNLLKWLIVPFLVCAMLDTEDPPQNAMQEVHVNYLCTNNVTGGHLRYVCAESIQSIKWLLKSHGYLEENVQHSEVKFCWFCDVNSCCVMHASLWPYPVPNHLQSYFLNCQ